MPMAKLKGFLDERRVKYVTMSHSPAYTAQEVAAAAHIPGDALAKTVMVKLDGRMTMAVVPATYRVDLEHLGELTGTHAELAREDEFGDLFPGCEVGAMPPFGNLWNIPVVISQSLARDEQIAFEAGSHAEVMVVSMTDFRLLVEPSVLRFSEHL